jgi:hypothetical protein
MDALYTLVIAGRDGSPMTDYVTSATTRATDVFPYLAPPNVTPPPARGGAEPTRSHDAGDHHHHHFGRPGW